MENAPVGTTKRLLRALLASGVLATAWVAIDLISNSDSASAVEIVDILPVGSGTPADDVVSATTAPLAPIAATVIPGAIAPVVEPLEPAVTDVVKPALPVVEAVTPPLQPVIEAALPLIEQVPALASVGELLAAGGLALGVVFVASAAPLLPLLPHGGGSQHPPFSSPPPSGSGGFSTGLLGESSAGILARLSATLSALADRVRLPLSPTYSFDTTPD